MPNQPVPYGDLMISPEQRGWVESSLTHLASVDFPEPEAQTRDAMSPGFWNDSWARPYDVRGGDLLVPVQGVLLHNFPFALGSWATGYDYIAAAVRRGVEDPEVDRIVMHVNSPGGLVAGCFDVVDAIYAARGEKPIVALVDENALSAGYAIASAADEIVMARTGSVGSVGVIVAHTEISRMLENAGITVNLIFAGDKKADGHPALPLTEKAQARIQERVDASYDLFVATVARNRDMEDAAVRATEADFFGSQEAVQNGLADRVGTLDTLSASAEAPLEQEDEFMSKENQAPAQAAAPTEEALAAATAQGVTQGAQNERTRIAAIMDSEEAKTRPAAARHVALNSDMAVEAAASFLKGLPEEAKATPEPAGQQKPQSGQSAFEQGMNNTPNPNLGAGAEDDNAGDDEMSDSDVANGIFASIGMRK